MRYLVTGQQMKEIDRYTIETVGIPSLVLMERAALGVAREVRGLAGKTDRIRAVCGVGNNGADGVAAARMLSLEGYDVSIVPVGDIRRGTREFQVQMEIAKNLGLPVRAWEDVIPGGCDVVIDGLFGVGLAREVEGEYRRVIEAINAMEKVRVVSVDLPSGIHSATGEVMGAALRADVTVTFGWEKLGSVLYPGREYCGRVVVEDIGFAEVSLRKAAPFSWTYEREDLKGLPARPAYSNKGTFGKVLLIAGSKGMSGAAFLAALAAYRMGAGLVKVMTVKENRDVLQQQLPEAIVTAYDPKELTAADKETKSPGKAWRDMAERECAWADVVAIGPGLGKDPYVKDLVQAVLVSAYVPIVLDADGLNTIARFPSLEQYYTENIVITPHLGEMARLTGKTIGQIKKDVLGTAREYAAARGVVCVLKDAATVVATREGKCYVNKSGNSCMAKAGSGDVLAGMIAALLAQGMEPFEAAALGVYIHGLAGDRYLEKHGSQSLLARELAEEAGKITGEKEQ